MAGGWGGRERVGCGVVWKMVVVRGLRGEGSVIKRSGERLKEELVSFDKHAQASSG